MAILSVTTYKRFVVSMICLSPLWAKAGEFEGTWKYDASAQFKVDFNPGDPQVKTIIFQAPGAVLNGNCRVSLKPTAFAFDEVFQPLLKQGLSAAQLEKFLKQKFNFTLSNKSQIYAIVGTPPECASPLREFFIEGNQLLVPVGGNFFYRYVKAAAAAPDAGAGSAAGKAVADGGIAAELAALKPTRMPFSFDAYYKDCARKLQIKGGALKAAEQCAPGYVPYAAAPGSKSRLLKLIGNHDYSKTGGENAFEYGTPFKFKRMPTFVVLPPHKGVHVLRVDDLEVIRDEERDRFSGAFISIKDGVIVDQLDTGCNFDAEFVCTDPRGKKVARLSDSGKFVEWQDR